MTRQAYPASVLLAISLCVFIPTEGQEQIIHVPDPSAGTSHYENSTEGLQELLGDYLTAAKTSDKEKMASFAKSMEVPNCDAWLHRMFDAEKADSWNGAV